MTVKIGEIILLCITILFEITATNLNGSHALAPSSTPRTTLFIRNDTIPLVFVSTYISDSVYQTQLIPSTTTKINTSFKTTLSLKHSAVSKIVTTTIKRTSSNRPILSSTFHPLSPSMSHSTITTSSASPTHKHPETKSSQPLVHKVGLIVGIVLGLVVFSVCLIAFHKKETRIKCLKLMCRPCRKNYSSRYNIVPIYVYDDTEQDIRELQDDSDLPLV